MGCTWAGAIKSGPACMWSGVPCRVHCTKVMPGWLGCITQNNSQQGWDASAGFCPAPHPRRVCGALFELSNVGSVHGAAHAWCGVALQQQKLPMHAAGRGGTPGCCRYRGSHTPHARPLGGLVEQWCEHLQLECSSHHLPARCPTSSKRVARLGVFSRDNDSACCRLPVWWAQHRHGAVEL